MPQSFWKRLGGEGLGLLALGGLAVFCLAVSWRKWPDPLIDFGRELYIPWRLTQGALLYRDVDDFYGPLSQYFNAGLFALFGPGLMVLVAANLAIFAAIAAAFYLLFRRAWGPGPALAATAVFIAAFGFSNYMITGNCNYATPYAHEATHGVLVCLLLAHALLGWMERPSAGRSAAAGLLLGLSAVLKPEILFAAGAVTVAALLFRRRSEPLRPAAIAAWALGAVLPSAAFAAFFSRHEPWAPAWAHASRAWLSLLPSSGLVDRAVQDRFLGLDRPWPHLVEHAEATGMALLVFAGLAAVARLSERIASAPVRWVLAAALAGALGSLAWFGIEWDRVGRCLLGLTVLYLLFQAAGLFRRRPEAAAADRGRARLLVAVLAAALMARMALNGRIYQFGFYQAALAGTLVPAVLIGELPGWAGRGRWSRGLIVAAGLVLIGSVMVCLQRVSLGLYGEKSLAVGHGRDRFYTFPPKVEPTGTLVKITVEWLRENPEGRTLLVLPEGEMINYLCRLPSPVAPFFFYSVALRGPREAELVRQLNAHPPDWIVLISRELQEYGIKRYGEAPGQGRLILGWVVDHYQIATATGGNPIDQSNRGVAILARR